MSTSHARGCAIVTGASSGIGAATAQALARAGYRVVVTYNRNRAGAEATVAACGGASEAVAVHADVALDEDCRRAVTQGLDAFGRLDVLVNNAGMTRYVAAGDLDTSGAEDFARIHAVNVIGPYQMIRAAAPALRASPAASIVNVSSHSGMSGDGSSLAYAVSKGALNTMTIGLARSLAPKVRVNAVCPGYVDTAWALGWQSGPEYEVFRARCAAEAPLGTMPEADDIADAVVWMAGARCVTGQLIVIDSGAHLGIVPPPV